MSNMIVLPDENALCPDLIRSVLLCSGKGVLCRDAQQRVVAWIAVTDEAKGKKVREIMTRIANDGRRSVQPDWSFLKDSKAVAK